MLGLVLRKSLVDAWDGLVPLFAANLVFLALLTAVAVGLELAAGSGPVLLAATAMGAAALLAMALAAYMILVAGWIEERRLDGARLRAAVTRVVLPAGLLAVPAAGTAGLAGLAVTGLGNDAVGIALAITATAATGTTALYLAWALAAAPGAAFGPWRSAGLMLFDNLGFAVVVVLAALAVTLLTAGLLPGVGGGLVLLRNAVCLRLRRYDGLPGESWSVLLAPEMQRMRQRPWRSVLVPWRS